MKVPPVHPPAPAGNNRERRAQMSVRRDKHTVTDSVTGEKFDLEPKAAWNKFDELNRLQVDEIA